MSLKDSTKSIALSAKNFIFGTLISRFFGLFREILMAVAFGTSPQVAAFWMAYRFSHLLRRVFGEGALNVAFIPYFENLRKEDPKKGGRFFYDLSTQLTFLLLLVTFISEGILGFFLFYYELKESTQEVVRLTMLMLPALVFISLYALNTSLLNCERKFFLPSVAPSFLNVVWIGGVFLFWKFSLEKPMEKLALVCMVAFAIQWLVTVPDVYHYLKKELGAKWWLSKSVKKLEIGPILRPFLLAILGVAATQINSALDSIFARIANSEGPAYLWYAIRIQQLPLALFGVGLSGALLPPIARAFRDRDVLQYQRFLFFALKQTLVFMVPVTFGILALGLSGIDLIYGHGQFSKLSVVNTTKCLIGYGIGLLPMTAVLILASAFYAQKNYRIPTLISLGSVLCNILLNGLFVFVFHLEALSIALATSLTALLNALFLAYYLKKEIGPFLRGIWPVFFKVSLAAVIATCATLLLGHHYFQDQTLIWLVGKETVAFSSHLHPQLATFCANGLIFVLVFAAMAFALKIRDFLDLVLVYKK